jgi:hypothetical protein
LRNILNDTSNTLVEIALHFSTDNLLDPSHNEEDDEPLNVDEERLLHALNSSPGCFLHISVSMTFARFYLQPQEILNVYQRMSSSNIHN